MKKRLLSLILALALVAGVLPGAVSAAEDISVTVRFSAPAVAEDLAQLRTDLVAAKLINDDANNSDIPANDITVTVPSGSTVKAVLEAAKKQQPFTIVGLDSYVTKIGFLDSEDENTVISTLTNGSSNLSYPGWSFFIDGVALKNGVGVDTVTSDGAVVEGVFSVYSGWDNTAKTMVYYDVELMKLYHGLDAMVKQSVDTSGFSDSAKAAYNAAKSEAQALLSELYAQAKLDNDLANGLGLTNEGMWIGFIASKGTTLYGQDSPIEQLKAATEKLKKAATGYVPGPCDLESLEVTNLSGDNVKTLTPAFSANELNYTTPTETQATGIEAMFKVKAVAEDSNAGIKATLNSGSERDLTSGSWTIFNGADVLQPGTNNKLLITVTNGAESKTYTVTIPMKDASGAAPAPDIDPNAVMHAIAAKYAGSGIAGDSNAPWLAADMAAYAKAFPNTANKLSDAQKREYLDELIPRAAAAAGPGDLAKYIIAFRAMGYDARKVITAAGETVDVVKKLTDLVDAKDSRVDDVYTLPYVIIALEQGEGYATDGQIAYLKEKALEIKDTWQTLQWGSTDAAPPMILALSPYYGESSVKAEIDNALQFIRNNQDAATGALNFDGTASAASTGIAAMAFASIGVDPASVKVSSGRSLMDGLMTTVNESMDGFDSAFVTEQGFRGLVAAALQGQNKGRLYDFSSMPMDTASAGAEGCPVRFSIVPGGAAVEVKLGSAVQSPKGANFYDLPAGSYTYTVTKSGYRDASGSFEVTASEAAAHTEKNISLSLISEPGEIEGEKELTVTVRVLTHDGDACGGKWTYKDNADKFTVLADTTVKVKAGQTAFDAFVLAMEKEGVSYTEKSSGYISEIAGQEEFGHGSSNSGWQYMIGRTLPTVSSRDYTLSSNVTITWFYTDDYTREKDSEQWSGGSGGAAVKPAEDGKTATQLKPEAAANADGEAVAAVTEEELSNTIAQAKSGKAEVIVIAPEVKGDANRVSVELPKSGVDNIAKQTGAALKVETGIADITIPQRSLNGLAGQSGSKVTVSAETVKDTKNIKIEVAVDGKSVQKLAGGIGVSVPSKGENSGNVLVIVNADGSETVVKKSVADGKTVAAVLDGSCTVKVVDNSKSFADTESHWSKEAVAFASSHELFNGVANDAFAPDSAMSRAMLATVLYRLEDAAASGSNPFADVAEGTWYTDAVVWASVENIVTGTGDGFAPDRDITRQELVTMLYRYANSAGLDTGKTAKLNGYTDSGDVADWAGDAMSWAVGNGLVSGRTSTTLAPTGTATRAEVAAVMQRLVEYMVK